MQFGRLLKLGSASSKQVHSGSNHLIILGLNAYHGDSSVAAFSDGKLVAALEEERLNRVKHWAGMPAMATAECLKGLDPDDVAHIAISRNPRANLGYKLMRAAMAPGAWKRLASRAKNQSRILGVRGALAAGGVSVPERARVHFVEHHRAHLASGFFASPFEEATVVSVDGFGDFSSIMWGIGSVNRIRVMGSVRFPHSLGIFYTAFTQFLGFTKYGDEYKMMGLAAYGEPRFAAEVRKIVRADGTGCRLNLDFFTHHNRGVEMSWNGGEPALAPIYSEKMRDAFGPPREPGAEIQARDWDLAASVQLVLEECYFALLNRIYSETKCKTLCLAGGVALNCAANGKIFERTPYRDVFIQPAAHDAGTSIGAGLYVLHELLNERRQFSMRHVYYGPEYGEAEIRKALGEVQVSHRRLEEHELIERTARDIADGKVVGWFQGRMEFGPRALGNRSILADPRRPEMKDVLNRRIKHREPFRPFCPSVLAEAAGDFFETSYPSPFMVMAYKIKPARRDMVRAVTHMDGTGRLQTVEKDVNPLYWKLIREFGDLTGVPVLINTSFNENEPIVNTPREALECFLRTQMDTLVLGPYFMTKAENAGLRKGANACARTIA